MPIVLDREVAFGNQHKTMVRRPIRFRNEALQIFPIGKINSAREAPNTIEHKPALHITPGAAPRRKRGSRKRIMPRSPDILLCSGVMHADDPVLHRQIGEYPRTGAAASSKLGCYLDHHADRHFMAAVARRLKQPIEAGLLEPFVSPARDEALPLRPKRLLAQHGDHGPCSLENCFSVGFTGWLGPRQSHVFCAHASRSSAKEKGRLR